MRSLSINKITNATQKKDIIMALRHENLRFIEIVKLSLTHELNHILTK